MTTFINGRFDIINGRLFFNKKEVVSTFNEVSKCNLRIAKGAAVMTFEYAKNCNDPFVLHFGGNTKLATKVYDFFKEYTSAEWWERRRRWAYGVSKEYAKTLLEGE